MPERARWLRDRCRHRQHQPRLGVAPDAAQLRRRHRSGQLRAQPAGGEVRDPVRGRRRQQRPVHRQHARGSGIGRAGAERGGSAKDWDVNHDDTLSGDTCAGWRHPRSSSFGDNDCRPGWAPAAVDLVVLVARPLGRPLAATRPRRAGLQHRLRPVGDRLRAARKRPQPGTPRATRSTRPPRAPRWRRRPPREAPLSCSRPTGSGTAATPAALGRRRAKAPATRSCARR